MIEILFLLGPLVVVPMAWNLVDGAAGRKVSLWESLLRRFAPWGVLASFLIERCPVAGALTLPWLGACALGALWGLRSMVRGGPWSCERVCNLVSAFYLPVGAGWAKRTKLRTGFWLSGMDCVATADRCCSCHRTNTRC